MDTCSAVSAKITAVLTECYEGVDNKEFDAITVKESLPVAPKRRHMINLWLKSQKGQKHTFGIKTCSAELGQRDHSSEKLKILQDQKDLEIMEAEYNAYIEVESR